MDAPKELASALGQLRQGKISDEVVRCLAEYECWDPLLEAVGAQCLDPRQDQRSWVSRYLQVKLSYQETVADVEVWLEKVTASLPLSFREWDELLRDAAPRPGDQLRVTEFLGYLQGFLPSSEERVACLEKRARMQASILRDETASGATFEQILAADPHNLPALRALKMRAVANRKYARAAEILEQMLSASADTEELHLAALELGAIYLHHLRRPAQALACMRQLRTDLWVGGPEMMFEIYLEMGDYTAAERVVLGEIKKKPDDPGELAALYLKLVDLAVMQGKFEIALAYVQSGLIVCESALVFHAKKIELLTATHNYMQIPEALGHLASFCRQPEVRAELTQTREVITSLLEYEP